MVTAKDKMHSDQELIFGIHPILEMLKAKKRKLMIIYTTKPVPRAWGELEKLLPKGIQIQYVARDVLTRMAANPDHQGILAYVKPFVYRKKFFEPAKQPFLLMLDSIQDTRNLGAILRSAHCTGVDGVIILKKNAAPLNAVALKASAGLAEHLEIYNAPSAAAAMQELKKAGYQTYLAVLDKKSKKATDITFEGPLCLVIGNEAVGVSKEILNAGQHIILPQSSGDISYNASVAAGILLFLMATQLKKI